MYFDVFSPTLVCVVLGVFLAFLGVLVLTQGGPFFHPCAQCGTKLPTSDPHDLCFRCLGLSHNPQSCELCLAFAPKALRRRACRFKLWQARGTELPPSSVDKMALVKVDLLALGVPQDDVDYLTTLGSYSSTAHSSDESGLELGEQSLEAVQSRPSRKSLFQGKHAIPPSTPIQSSLGDFEALELESVEVSEPGSSDHQSSTIVSFPANPQLPLTKASVQGLGDNIVQLKEPRPKRTSLKSSSSNKKRKLFKADEEEPSFKDMMFNMAASVGNLAKSFGDFTRGLASKPVSTSPGLIEASKPPEPLGSSRTDGFKVSRPVPQASATLARPAHAVVRLPQVYEDSTQGSSVTQDQSALPFNSEEMDYEEQEEVPQELSYTELLEHMTSFLGTTDLLVREQQKQSAADKIANPSKVASSSVTLSVDDDTLDFLRKVMEKPKVHPKGSLSTSRFKIPLDDYEVLFKAPSVDQKLMKLMANSGVPGPSRAQTEKWLKGLESIYDSSLSNFRLAYHQVTMVSFLDANAKANADLALQGVVRHMMANNLEALQAAAVGAATSISIMRQMCLALLPRSMASEAKDALAGMPYQGTHLFGDDLDSVLDSVMAQQQALRKLTQTFATTKAHAAESKVAFRPQASTQPISPLLNFNPQQGAAHYPSARGRGSFRARRGPRRGNPQRGRGRGGASAQ